VVGEGLVSFIGCVAKGLMGDVWWVDVWCGVSLMMLLFAHSEATLDRPEAMTLEAFGSFRGRASRNIHMLVVHICDQHATRSFLRYYTIIHIP
jgi:hypothetical protein